MKASKIILASCLALAFQFSQAAGLKTYTLTFENSNSDYPIVVAPRQNLFNWKDGKKFDIAEYRLIAKPGKLTFTAKIKGDENNSSDRFLATFPAEVNNNKVKYIITTCSAEQNFIRKENYEDYGPGTDVTTIRISCGRLGFNQYTNFAPILNNHAVEIYKELEADKSETFNAFMHLNYNNESNSQYFTLSDGGNTINVKTLGRSNFLGDFECANDAKLFDCIYRNMQPYQNDFHPGKVTFSPITITSSDNVPLAIGYGTPGKWEYGNVVGRSIVKNQTTILREAYNEVNDNAIYSFKVALPKERTTESDGTYISYVQTVCSLQSLRGSNDFRAVGAINCGYKNTTVEAVANRSDKSTPTMGVEHKFNEGGDILWLGTDMSVSLDNNNRYKLVMSCKYNTLLTGPQACPSSTEYVDKLNSKYKTFKCKLDDNISTCVENGFNNNGNSTTPSTTQRLQNTENKSILVKKQQ